MKEKVLFSVILSFVMLASCDGLNTQVEIKDPPPKPMEPDIAFLDTLESGVAVLRRGDSYYLEGDILLSAAQLQSLRETGSVFGEIVDSLSPARGINPVTNLPNDVSDTRAMGLYPTSYNLWAMCRFTYSSSLTTYQRNKIKAALEYIESVTNVRFYNATGQPTSHPILGIPYPYIEFVPFGNMSYCDSGLGRVGGRQEIRLANFAFEYGNLHVIIHEICHSLGMMHEQCRPDRDEYVIINTSNLTEMGLSQFTKRTFDYYCLDNYDFNSVMGYDSYTSADTHVYNTNLPMYTKLDGSEIFQGLELSFDDRRWLNTLYVPYIARSDTYNELDDVVYKSNNEIMTAEERLQYQAQLNNGNPNPPSGGHIPNDF